MEANIINLFYFTFKTFCKRFRIVNNDEEVYMQLQNIQQQTAKRVEVYYERLFKLAICLQVKTRDFFSPLFSGQVYYLT
jgi:hypothetical protein